MVISCHFCFGNNQQTKCRDTAEKIFGNLSPANSENQQPSKSSIQQIIHWPISHFFWSCFFITNTIKKSKLATIKILTTILSRVLNVIHVYQWNKAIWFVQMKLLRDIWFSLLREVVDTKLKGLITGEPFSQLNLRVNSRNIEQVRSM
jgi:hypothetical protein